MEKCVTRMIWPYKCPWVFLNKGPVNCATKQVAIVSSLFAVTSGNYWQGLALAIEFWFFCSNSKCLVFLWKDFKIMNDCREKQTLLGRNNTMQWVSGSFPLNFFSCSLLGSKGRESLPLEIINLNYVKETQAFTQLC